ncbi:MAG: hypothetical protein K2P81_14100 [Bacteriovoracaceae bacterium]|nr:hypothetical protein [Bacteriovoracaceae bacterium]
MKLKSFIFILLMTLAGASWSAQDFTGSVGALSNQLNENVGDVAGNRYNMDLNFEFHRNRSNELERKFTANALMNDANGTMYSVNEAYLSSKWGRSELKFGRSILDWSDIDAHWGFGKINNRQNFSGFTPGQEGLTGIVFSRRYSNGFRYHFFATPIYVPETNPSLDINKTDGTITSKNPWSKPPAASANISNRDIPIFYKVDYPSITDVVFKPSGGINLGWGNKHWDGGFYYLRKPENQVSTTVDISYNPGDDIINARIQPQFFYHDIYGGNLRWKNKDITVYASAVAIRPNDYPVGDPLVTQYTQIEVEKRREDYVGGGISKENDRLGTGFDYVARLSPFNKDEDILAEDPRWNQAVHGWVRYRFNRFFQVSGDVKYDMLTTDRLTMLKVSYYPTRNMAVNAGVNMIGTPSNGKSYWSPYTNNDAVYAGLRYLF